MILRVSCIREDTVLDIVSSFNLSYHIQGMTLVRVPDGLQKEPWYEFQNEVAVFHLSDESQAIYVEQHLLLHNIARSSITKGRS
jgi:hypothetical protein